MSQTKAQLVSQVSDAQNNTTGGSNAGDSFTGTDANDNTLFGYDSGTAITTGHTNTAVGSLALDANTTGNENTALGKSALGANTTGTNNLSLGSDTMLANTTGSNNVAVGYGALQVNTTANDNTAVGDRALFNNTTGANNTALGHDALKANTTASNNTAIGHLTLDANTTGTFNTAVGTNAGGALTTGDYNTFIGTGTIAGTGNFGAGDLMTTGNKNTFLGGYNGNQNGLDLRTSSNNVIVSDGDGNPVLHNAVSAAIDEGNVDVTHSSSTANAISLADGATITLFGGGNNFSGVFILNDFTSTGETAIFITGGGAVSIVGQTGAAYGATSTPASGKYGVFVDGTTVKIKSNRGAAASFRLIGFRTRTSQ